MPKKKTTATKRAATAKRTATKKATSKKKTPKTAKLKKTNSKKKQIGSIKHKDKRVNIPTEELRDFVSDDENAPQKMLYPRDPSLDPQLVWNGKDVQDREDLEVPVVPIYIQEKIHPQAITEHLRARTKQGEDQFGLFDDFNGIKDFEKKIEFYHHESNWTNRMILGDSLLVMNSLAEKEGLKGRVQMVYIDPPYGINFDSNWQVSTRKNKITDGRSTDMTRQPEQIRAFRDTWKLGIHSYLAYLRDRFILSRELMTESGSIFVQIGDENVHLVRNVLDEVFGSDNFVAQIRFRKKTMPLGATYLERMGDYLIWYTKDHEAGQTKYHQLYQKKDYSTDFHWQNFELEDGTRIKLTKEQIETGYIPPKGARRFRLVSLWPASYNREAVFPVKYGGKEWLPAKGQCWPTNPEGMKKLVDSNQIEPEGKYLRKVLYEEGADFAKLTVDWPDTIGARDKSYVVETSPLVVQRCMLMCTDPGDIVLDPTCGSGTTAFVAEQWGRRWITIDSSRVALALSRTRIMTAQYPYYLLMDSKEGSLKDSSLTGKAFQEAKYGNDVKMGFVNNRVPHITLRAIINNPDITEGMERADIDKAILRYADSLLLYDAPCVDKKKVRVTGPLTVESLSPHRVLETDRKQSDTEETARTDSSNNFGNIIIENLKKSGVQNTIKNERLKFDFLDVFAGAWIHATGEFTDKDGKTKRIAVSIGPEHGTVGPQQVKEAAKEAVQGVGYDVLVVCGFAFDPHVSEEAKRYGKLVVLPTQMNPDLAMGDELLKKTGAGNLFMVFGEPDLKVSKEKDGNISVELLGVDVYDPTTGEIRSSSTDDIACWFIDTEYNGESFFVRHAYFTGGDKPYEKLKKALKAEINEEAWETLYSTTSRPFPKPETGKIAVKVINHYGDEVLKVYEV